ncbi:MAG: metallophosphoesterase [Spirochaetaceae bacterium]|nr:metallophosphoesterase [Spirochaetaceae bacterium]
MKILCVSDFIDPLVYSASIKDRYRDVDLVLSAGDMPLDYLEFIVSSLDRPLLHVFGNHNLEAFERYRSRSSPILSADDFERTLPGLGTTHISDKVVREGGLLIAGLGGSMQYNRGLNQWTNFQMNLRIMRLVPRLLLNKLLYGRYLDILLTHAPPLGIHDREDPCHKGFKAFLWFMRVFKPRYLLHGHIHLYDLAEVRKSTYNATDIINVYSHYILEI